MVVTFKKVLLIDEVRKICSHCLQWASQIKTPTWLLRSSDSGVRAWALHSRCPSERQRHRGGYLCREALRKSFRRVKLLKR